MLSHTKAHQFCLMWKFTGQQVRGGGGLIPKTDRIGLLHTPNSKIPTSYACNKCSGQTGVGLIQSNSSSTSINPTGPAHYVLQMVVPSDFWIRWHLIDPSDCQLANQALHGYVVGLDSQWGHLRIYSGGPAS